MSSTVTMNNNNQDDNFLVQENDSDDHLETDIVDEEEEEADRVDQELRDILEMNNSEGLNILQQINSNILIEAPIR